MNKNSKLFFFLIFYLIINTVDAQNTTIVSNNGIWKMRGYGKMIEINDSVVNNYDVTAISRTLNSQIKKESIKELGELELKDKDVLALKQGNMIYLLDRISEFPTIENSSERLKDPNYVFDVFWNTMNENYPFFKERDIDWSTIQKKYGDGKIKNNRQLKKVLRKIIGQLNDGHTTLIAKNYSDSDSHPHYRSNNRTSNLENQILNHYVKKPKKHGRSIKGNGLLNYGITENNVGYIQINNMMFFQMHIKSRRIFLVTIIYLLIWMQVQLIRTILRRKSWELILL